MTENANLSARVDAIVSPLIERIRQGLADPVLLDGDELEVASQRLLIGEFERCVADYLHDGGDGCLQWAVSRWQAEVGNRPMVNVHRRTLDDTWRQVIRRLGGDDRALVGSTHDEILSAG